ncbi:MAG: tetratricopeptide repeat protein, partial [Myxococcota bacterium]
TRWGRGFRIRFELAYRSGDFDAAEAHAQRVHDHAKWHGWPDLEFRAVLDLATLSGARGERELAAARVARALAMPVAADPLLAAHGRQAEGMVHAMQGDHAAARIAFDEATLRFERLGEPVEAANAARFGALAALRSGDTSGAIDAASSARERFVRLGHRPGIAAVDNTLGEAHRATGDLASAEQWYRSARDGMRRLGMGRVVVPETNLAIVLLDLGRPGEARAMLEAIARDPACRIRASIHAAVRALLLAASADERDWPAVDAAIGLARDAIGVGGRVDPDTDRALLRAVRAARAAGDEPRAAAIEALLAEP